MRLRDAIEGFLLLREATISPRTLGNDRLFLRQFAEWHGPDEDVNGVTTGDVQRYVKYASDERELAPASVTRHLVSLSAFYTWLMSPDVGLADHHPVRGVARPPIPKLKPKALNKEEVDALIEAASGGKNPRRDKALVLFFLDTATRASEVCAVQLSEVNTSTGRVRVMGKGSKERFVNLGRRALAALWLYLKEERPEPSRANDDTLFLTSDGYAFDRHSLRRVVYRLAARAGIKVFPHQFRHTSAIEHLRHGMDLLSLQRYLGHETLEVTRVYLTALTDEDVEEQARRTSPADNWRLEEGGRSPRTSYHRVRARIRARCLRSESGRREPVKRAQSVFDPPLPPSGRTVDLSSAAPCRYASYSIAWCRFAPRRFAPSRSASRKSARRKSAPARLASRRSALLKRAPCKFAPARLAPFKSAPRSDPSLSHSRRRNSSVAATATSFTWLPIRAMRSAFSASRSSFSSSRSSLRLMTNSNRA
jgi:site-specific recombinase XerD